MSHLVRNLVYSKIVGKTLTKAPGVPQVSAAVRKAVLLAYADRANDDGGDCYVSKVRIAAELEYGRQAVVAATQSLIADSILIVVGRRPARNGYTDNHRISIKALHALPDTFAKCLNPDTLDDALVEGDEPVGKALGPVDKWGKGRRQSVATADTKVSGNRRQSVATADTEHPNRTSSNRARMAPRPALDGRRAASDPEYASEFRDGGPDERDEHGLMQLRKLQAIAKDGREITAGEFAGVLPSIAARIIAERIASIEDSMRRRGTAS